MRKPHALLVPATPSSEFDPPLQDCHRLAETISIPSLHDPLPTSPPTFVALFQHWPGQFQQKNVHQIKSQFPLAPILLFLGSTSQGEARTGQPLRGTHRLYAHEWNDFYRQQLQQLLCKQPSLFTLPPTVSEEEIILFQAAQNQRHLAAPRKSRIQPKACLVLSRCGPFGNDPAFNRLLALWHQAEGHEVLFFPENKDNSFHDIVLADADDSPFSEILQAAQRLRRLFADAEIRVYLASPRIDEVRTLHEFGIGTILPKPVFWQTSRHLPPLRHGTE